ncbi:MAG: molybdenum cofactor biosynthesis protein MoaE [Acidimicrobiia bacterium]
MLPCPAGPDWVLLTGEPLTADAAIVWATTPSSGAVVSFSGVVRRESEGRADVEAITYEAYEEQASRVLRELVGEVRARYPEVDRVVLWHRVGRVARSEPSVVVVVSSAHRGESFDAARFAIDTLKETVPIWKLEHRGDASSWVAAGRPIRPVGA